MKNKNVKSKLLQAIELRRKAYFLEKEAQEECPHEELIKSGGDIWHDWPDWGYDPYRYRCALCGSLVWEGHGRFELNEKVIEDNSAK